MLGQPAFSKAQRLLQPLCMQDCRLLQPLCMQDCRQLPHAPLCNSRLEHRQPCVKQQVAVVALMKHRPSDDQWANSGR